MTPWDDLWTRADASLDAADALTADILARQVVEAFSDWRPRREGHFALIQAHVRALIAGGGLEFAADYVRELADDLGDLVAEVEAGESAEREKAAWETKNPRRRVRAGGRGSEPLAG
jgi:hypothetical protein